MISANCDGAVTSARYTPPTESWFPLKPYSIFDTEQGTAPHPIGQTAMNEITAVYCTSEVCLYSRGVCILLRFEAAFSLWYICLN